MKHDDACPHCGSANQTTTEVLRALAKALLTTAEELDRATRHDNAQDVDDASVYAL